MMLELLLAKQKMMMKKTNIAETVFFFAVKSIPFYTIFFSSIWFYNILFLSIISNDIFLLYISYLEKN